jgi:hypothetical protein
MRPDGLVASTPAPHRVAHPVLRGHQRVMQVVVQHPDHVVYSIVLRFVTSH